jgi:G2/mitotic-specific cyclin-B3
VHVIFRNCSSNFAMAPTRLASKPIGVNENMNGILTHGITTRSKQLASLKSHKDGLKVPYKRKADSPLKDLTAKRAAFGDITNAINKSCATHDKDKIIAVKKVTVESKLLPTLKVIVISFLF